MSPFGQGYGQQAPPVIPIGITLEEDGWWLWCPECDVALGPYEGRETAARVRGSHLISKHGAVNFAAGRPSRAIRLTARRVRGETRW